MKRSGTFSRLMAVSCIACALFGATQANARSLEQILDSKKIIIGVNPNLPPLGVYDEKNEISGFDASVAHKIADSLGVKLELVAIGSNDRIPFILSDKIDAVMGGMTRNADRMKVVDFTDPVNTEVLGILTTESKPYKDWHQLNDPAVRLVQVRGTTPIKFIQENIPKAQLLILDNYPDAVRAIAQGRADALIDVLDFMFGYTKNYPTKWRVVDDPLEVDYDCIGVRKGNTALTQKLNQIIAEQHKSGFIADSWTKWFGHPMLHDPTQSPTQQ
ncbi:amino acid ABC transporter substrate-binding protein (PAAT family) [Gibbsiella quercinecans]|uniref:Amino acid ABC transporter n=2 Tax=Gibbsiella TaxID=929812 RepID=A0A250B2I9_9GAMM|nr:transporter substrate-binding domain-containing protein [Gibbsiella quercinecans]ATA20463.1 amino acid ABC transporter [Gibbsiella quercinecans]RLM07472.1 amino acid ABC transporter [Gibbsiella quercinecans]RLM10818.1 amino acid ABC transporter [Gibbsiella quercinecans]RLM11166.1 amino acid ABC transporter [Gibbsiella quercinecans]TCT89396.1 amino acid ABC transporter substrate-binding protein (PAAT family) [Gibbsiella quercinecans]